MSLTLHVRLSSGRVCDFKVEPNTRIEDLKKQVSAECSIEAVQLKLIIEGRALDDKATVESLNLKDGMTLTTMTSITA